MYPYFYNFGLSLVSLAKEGIKLNRETGKGDGDDARFSPLNFYTPQQDIVFRLRVSLFIFTLPNFLTETGIVTVTVTEFLLNRLQQFYRKIPYLRHRRKM